MSAFIIGSIAGHNLKLPAVESYSKNDMFGTS